MDEEILFRAKSETLVLIKNEAEKNFLGIQNAEDVITNKSNNLMQVLIPVFLVICGFCVNSFVKNDFSWLFLMAVCLLILLGVVIFMLHKNILPVKSAILGSEPSQLIQSDMISGVHSQDERNLLVNRVHNLQNAIEYSLTSHSSRYRRFRHANKILLLGLLIIVSLFVLSQVFLLFLDKCSCL
ncbi:hypothetical protein [Croceiramulus getboli]|nr:hypothetical protein P8624_00070 [Flavobacteriaceae bacterium YJPT1-3]